MDGVCQFERRSRTIRYMADVSQLLGRNLILCRDVDDARGAAVDADRRDPGVKRGWWSAWLPVTFGIICITGCAQLAVWDVNGNKLEGIPVVVGSVGDERMVYVNIISSPLGNASILIEIDEKGHLKKVQTIEDTSQLSATELLKLLPVAAAVVAAKQVD